MSVFSIHAIAHRGIMFAVSWCFVQKTCKVSSLYNRNSFNEWFVQFPHIGQLSRWRLRRVSSFEGKSSNFSCNSRLISMNHEATYYISTQRYFSRCMQTSLLQLKIFSLRPNFAPKNISQPKLQLKCTNQDANLVVYIGEN